ncbi:MAG: polysaccharide deacetylase family protein [Burkholderiaceae bacterium]|nr:polysaccharide deacetylase family protein [Burkholderiaceae bacterium]MDO9089607.1 polysaccharide deacetylase family protein [Burkholderiaceae bacterium]
MKRDPGLYDYLPYDAERPKIKWPNGAHVAFMVAPNIEFYELDPPMNPTRPSWPRPVPDITGYTYRDYGNRAGFWRMMDVIDGCGIRGTVSLNVSMCDHHPEIIRECASRGWEFFSHGTYNGRYMYNMSEEQERQLLRDSLDKIQNHLGQSLDGWLAPALTYTEHTIDIVAEMGLRYVCDLFHDDQPTPLNTRSGKLISMPYSIEVNDTGSFNVYRLSPNRYCETLKRQFDRLYQEGETSGTVMCAPLHPYLVGHPLRIDAFKEALTYITGHDKVWFATGREIAKHFTDNYFDAFKAASHPVGEAP